MNVYEKVSGGQVERSQHFIESKSKREREKCIIAYMYSVINAKVRFRQSG